MLSKGGGGAPAAGGGGVGRFVVSTASPGGPLFSSAMAIRDEGGGEGETRESPARGFSCLSR